MQRRFWKLARWAARILVVLILLSWWVIPTPAFEDPNSTILEASDGHLMGARLAEDEQWRFPEMDSVPAKFEACLLEFEDKHFHWHPGVNPVSLGRAFVKNLQAGAYVQGGSTISMQVARMYRKGKARNLYQKLVELLLAFHFEINYSKEELLKIYVSNAPFGGNVVGLKAAAWRYFGRSTEDLSWSEYAALAVLPNAPSLIFPGRNEGPFRRKRDALLKAIFEEGLISEQDYDLALLENLPAKPMRLPNFARHLTDRADQLKKGQRVRSTVDYHLQREAQTLVNQYAEQYAFNEVYNAAAIVIDVKSGNLLAYVGNSTNSFEHNNWVDVVKAPRSTGSVLKPFLYASMISKAELMPHMLIPDIPTFIAGYSPKNYHLNFDGAVFADEALYRSLNVPFVRLLRKHSVDRFYHALKEMGMKSLVYESGHYGLSLILGGAEGSLLELTSMYAGLARHLGSYSDAREGEGFGPGSGRYSDSSFFRTPYFDEPVEYFQNPGDRLSAAAIYETFKALSQVKRPVGREGWKSFNSSSPLAWKTGTSFGNKDAWAIGLNPDYAVGVWVGNADGEGRSGLTGLNSAAPLLFDLVELLPKSSWFEEPLDQYREVLVCRASGRIASPHCVEIDTTYLPNVNYSDAVCEYHRSLLLSKNRQERVNMNCASMEEVTETSWFVLPPAQEWYYKLKSPTYRSLPPWRAGCLEEEQPMDFIYPSGSSKIYIPKELDGSRGKALFEIAHRKANTSIFWHLDNSYLGTTQDLHQVGIGAESGWHVLVVVDEDGNELVKRFEVLSGDR